MHRPHSLQVTGACCKEVAARQSWAEYSSRPTTDSRHHGWAIKDFSVLSEMHSLCEQPFYDIILMMLHIKKSCILISNQNLQIVLNPFKIFPMLWDTCAAFSYPIEHARHDTLDPHWARTCWTVMGQWLQSQPLSNMTFVTQHLFTCEEQVTTIWSTNLHCTDV